MSPCAGRLGQPLTARRASTSLAFLVIFFFTTAFIYLTSSPKLLYSEYPPSPKPAQDVTVSGQAKSPSKRLSEYHPPNPIPATSKPLPDKKDSPPKRLGYPILADSGPVTERPLIEDTPRENYDLGCTFELATKTQVLEYITKSKSLSYKPQPQKLLNTTLNPCWREPSHRASYRPKVNSGRVCMPHFYIGGFAKSGTTGLWAQLMRHPQVVDVIQNTRIRWTGKEPHWLTRYRFDFFRRRFRYHNRETMSRFFQIFDRVDIHKAKSVVGDGSPDTIWDVEYLAQDTELTSPLTPATDAALRDFRLTIVQIVQQYAPNSKYIVMMRNPTDRLFSNYVYMSKPWDISKKGFHDFVARMVPKLNACFKARNVRSCIYDPELRTEQNKANIRLYLGIYIVPVMDLVRVVPHENAMFIHFEDFVHETKETVLKVLHLLGLDTDPKSMARMNFARVINRRPNYKPAHMLPETRPILDRFYAPFNQILAEKMDDKRYNWPIRDVYQ